MADESYSWWNSLKHGGLLISPSRLPAYFPEEPSPLPPWLVERLRRDLTRVESNASDAEAVFLETVLEKIAGLESGWEKGSQIRSDWSRRALSGEMIKPRWLWHGPHETYFPVFVDSKISRIGVGRGRRSVSRVLEWLRASDQKIALLTNLKQWRLIYAGLDFDAWAEWDTELWFEEGAPGPQVTALRALFSQETLAPEEADAPPPLLAAIQESRKGQAELSSELGERVRLAVERLIQEHGAVLEQVCQAKQTDPRSVYIAATRMIMRLVVVLFAEARDLLPRDNPVYHGSYGLQGLRESLERAGGATNPERLRHRYGAWPRIIGLCRLVSQGSHHAALPVPRYGGDLFAPGDVNSSDPVRHALAVFEDPEHAPSDAVVFRIINYLGRSRVKVRQGRASTWVDAPVDFSDLSSEYIGILYEGLLDFELRQAQADDPMVFLALGDEPALPLSRLDSMEDKQLKELVEKFKVSNKDKALQEEEGAEDEEEETDTAIEDEEALDQDVEQNIEEPVEEIAAADSAADVRQQAREQARIWARRAVAAGNIVRKPRSRRREALEEFEQKVDKAADLLIKRVILPGEWFLVRWGGTRKGAGTFYTRPQLAVPTVQRTLRPLAFELSKGDGPLIKETAPASSWSPKTPETILQLKVCDPAMGSGSFLVASLRFLTDALYQSLHHHQRLQTEGDQTLVTLAEGRASEGKLTEELLPCRSDDDEFEPRLRARLKRYVVERCIYGVDIDSLAVELARLSLWIETMDRDLPFEFLDHKLKNGNALIGCWFDRFRDYPALAWEREGGDKNHNNGVHYEKETWTKAIKQFRKDRVQAELPAWIVGQHHLLNDLEGLAPDAIHDEAVAALQQMHAIPVHETEARAQYYLENIASNPAIAALKQAFDTWCAIWFWPPEHLDTGPRPSTFEQLGSESQEIVSALHEQFRFFHWELEYPDVFTGEISGFDAVVGNPPWEIQKPNSKEFFSNLDPLYRAYGKQEALQRQTAMFETSPGREREWLEYNSRFKALSNWCKNVGSPFGDEANGGNKLSLGRGNASRQAHAAWAVLRARYEGHAEPDHPFLHQGSADINTYKMFLETSYSLLHKGGQMGMLVPSGIYTDKGTTDLRKLFLNKSRWRWIFGFINWNKIFESIYYRFKFAIVIVEKGGQTDRIATAFSRYHIEEWQEPGKYLTPVTHGQIKRFSPISAALLETRDLKDLEVLGKLYENAVLLGDQQSSGWGLRYACEFHMTNDSKLFTARAKWEEKGYEPDQYGRWIGPDGSIALPLYEGRMIGQFDFSSKGWVRGTGRGAVWREIGWGSKQVEPHYLMNQEVRDSELLRKHLARIKRALGKEEAKNEELRLQKQEEYSRWKRSIAKKLAFMDVTSATNARTAVASVIPGFPCNHKTPTLMPCRGGWASILTMAAVMNSVVFDFMIRARLGGTSLTWSVIEETAIKQDIIYKPALLSKISSLLSIPDNNFADIWYELAVASPEMRLTSWKSKWAITRHERLRLRCMLDAIIAEYFCVSWSDFEWILKDCDQPKEKMSGKDLYRTLDPKGFWRNEKGTNPEMRHTVLALFAFHDLKALIASCGGDSGKGIQAFCAQNNGEGWMLPETLCLAELGLGHDDRAKEAQLVRERFGQRFLGWQLEQDPEESWAECEHHARNILGEEGFAQLQVELQAGEEKEMVASSAVEEISKAESKDDSIQGALF